MTLSEKIILLSATLWLSAIAFIVYTCIVEARFQKIFKTLLHKIDRLEKALSSQQSPEKSTPSPDIPVQKSKPETTIKIDKNEPLSKYETVTLPDEININFVDR